LALKKGSAGSGDEYMQLLSILCMIGGSFLWVSGSLFLKYNPSKTSAYVNTSIQLLAAGIFCLLISLFRNEPQQLVIASIHPDAIGALCYISIVSRLITFMAFVWLIKVRPPAIVSTYLCKSVCCCITWLGICRIKYFFVTGCCTADHTEWCVAGEYSEIQTSPL
jgi:drug/metabolite transporter (DMT)-like permease